MSVLQGFKLGMLAFAIGALLSAVVTLSFQAIEEEGKVTQPWVTSSPFGKDDEYYESIATLLIKYKQNPLLSKYLLNAKASAESESKLSKSQFSNVAGVILPGGEKLVGIVSKNGHQYALLAGKESLLDNVIEVSQGDQLPSGYILVKIEDSAIVLQAPDSNEILIELYQ